MLHRRVERHRHRIVELVRRPLQHLRRLLEELPERTAAAAGILLVDRHDGNAPVHRCLRQPRDITVLVQKGLVVEVEQEHNVALERGRVSSLERLLSLADHDWLGVDRNRAAPLARSLLDLLRQAGGAAVDAAHEDGDGAAEGKRLGLAGHHHAVGELG